MKLKLNDIYELQMGKTPARKESSYWNGNNAWVSISDLSNSGKYISKTKEYITNEGVKESGIKMVPQGTLMMSFKLSLGKVAIAEKDLYTNEAIMSFLDRQKYEIDIDYMYYQLQAVDWNAYTKKAVKGATLNKATLSNVFVEVPSIEEQRMIKEKLSYVDKAINITANLLNLIDELIKSRFIEMFGDPVTNSKGFPTRRGEEFFKLSNGKAVPLEKRKESGVPAYGGNGISWYTDDVLCKFDTIVVGRVGVQSGNVHFVKAPLWVTDNAMYISWFDANVYNLIFLNSLMERIGFSKFQDIGDLKKVTQKPFMQFQYICPPIEMQIEYVNFLHQVDKSKLTIKKSMDNLRELRDSLLQEYFG